MMKNSWLVGLLVATACSVSVMQAQSQARDAGTTIGVRVASGQVKVANVQARVSSGSPAITWQLQTAGYRFTAGSIDFGASAGNFRCSVSGTGQSMRCVRNSNVPAGEASYTVTVEATSAAPAAGSDPSAVIMLD